MRGSSNKKSSLHAFMPKLCGLVLASLVVVCLLMLPQFLDPIVLNMLERAHIGGSPFWNLIIWVSWVLFVFGFAGLNTFFLTWAALERRRRKKNFSGVNGKVTMLSPAYNEEHIIKDCVNGLSGQSYGDKEVLIVNDGSTDKTGQILEEVANANGWMRVINHKKNRGKPKALNTGFKQASGNITVFSDSDGELAPDFLEKIVPHFKDPEVGMVAGYIAIRNNKSINISTPKRTALLGTALIGFITSVGLPKNLGIFIYVAALGFSVLYLVTVFLTKLQEIEYIFSQLVIRFCQALSNNVLICPGAGSAVRTKIGRAVPSRERTLTEDADFTFSVHEKWKIGQEIDAVSYTEAPTTLREFFSQRARWLYGVWQTLRLHKWAIKDIWVLWAWLGYAINPVSIFFLCLAPFLAWQYGWSFTAFWFVYASLAFAIFAVTRYIPLRWTKHKSKHLWMLLPLYAIYQIMLNAFLFILLMAWVTRTGVKVRYGGKIVYAL